MHITRKLVQEIAVAPNNRDRALKIIAKSIYKELRQANYDAKEIVALSTELISLVTSDMRIDSEAARELARESSSETPSVLP